MYRNIFFTKFRLERGRGCPQLPSPRITELHSSAELVRVTRTWKPVFQSSSLFLLVLSSLFILCSCSSEYENLVEKELSTGIRKDSLFLGIHFGMSKKDFYTHCWELNKQGIIRQGSRNQTVMQELTTLKHPAIMDFYPNFQHDTIYEMPVTFIYKGWAPWNKQLSSDSLQLDVVRLMEEWYGKGFIKVEHPQRGATFVKVDGNRQIIVWKDNDLDVKALYSDLLKKDVLEKTEEPIL